VTASSGPAAGVHLPWAEVPAAVRTWAARVGGGAPATVRDMTGGFSPGATALLGCPRGAIFVKAVGAGLNPDSPELHRRRLLDLYDDGDWVALAFEGLDGRPPLHPWDRDELRSAVRALDALHVALTPNPAFAALPAAERLQPVLGGWADLAAMGQPPVGLHDWSGRHLDRLAELESGWPTAIAGATLLHCDVRSDNLLVTPCGVVFVDWPHACVGAPVFDLVAWAPSVELEGGPPPEELLALSATGSVIDRDALAPLVAAFGGFLVRHSLQPPPPGLPTLRAFQAAQGAVAQAWVRRLTGW
jgi:hypothetical protein